MEIKFQEKGYGQGFYDGQMQERKYWQEKIKNFTIEDEQIFIQFGEIIEKKKWKNNINAKIEELKKLNDEATSNCYGYGIHFLQSLLEKE